MYQKGIVIGPQHRRRFRKTPMRLDPIHQQSLELVQSVTTGPARRALERFDKQIGTGHASADVHEIVRAAPTGRVEQPRGQAG